MRFAPNAMQTRRSLFLSVNFAPRHARGESRQQDEQSALPDAPPLPEVSTHGQMGEICKAIPRITPREIDRADLPRLFHEVPAVVLREDDRVGELLESVLDWLGLDDRSPTDCFGGSLVDLARNHQKGNMSAGDMLRFVPGLFGHVSRKFVVCPSGVDRSLRAYPDSFHVGHRRLPVPYDILRSVWNLTSDVLAKALPEFAGNPAYATEVDVLSYPTSSLDVTRLFALLTDSTLLADSASFAGFWSRLGHRIDAARDNAAGVFGAKVMRDIFAISSLIPGLKGFVTTLNERLSQEGERSVPRNYRVIGAPHVDNAKYITALAGRRENLYTEIFWADRWIRLPVTSDDLAIFPSGKAATLSDIPATRHRVLLYDPPGSEASVLRNVTLSISIVDRPSNLVENTQQFS
ncbi:MAG TPA: hypothetical protein VEF07_04180 [Candidatus Binataceae bacterium]|nr:hypothetical protein [Candidatus Binataceae bacterium]